MNPVPWLLNVVLNTWKLNHEKGVMNFYSVWKIKGWSAYNAFKSGNETAFVKSVLKGISLTYLKCEIKDDKGCDIDYRLLHNINSCKFIFRKYLTSHRVINFMIMQEFSSMFFFLFYAPTFQMKGNSVLRY